MYDKLIAKNINHFSQDGLIMYSKHCDYYNINPITLEDIKMFYDLLYAGEPLPKYINAITQLSCCLYFLSKKEDKYIDIFIEKLIKKLSRKDEPNDTNLFLIYNIIEFDQRYLHSKGNKLVFLLNYLEKFSSTKKTVENFLLFKYYRGVLLSKLGKIEDAYSEYLEIIIGSEDYVKNKTKYIDFIRLKNDLLKVQLDLGKHIKGEYYEQYCFMKELFDRVKGENKKLGIKLGFCLYKILCRQNKYNECIPLLMEIKRILKNESLSGVKMKISIDYSLAIISRIGYIGTLIGDRKILEYGIKKLNKLLNIIENDKEDKKLSTIYNAYSFIIAILNVNLGSYENKLMEKASTFHSEFLPNNFDSQRGTNYIINNKNKESIIINLNAINNMDANISTLATKIMNNYINSANLKNPLPSNQFLTFIVGIHDIINRLSESFSTDININKRKEYIQQINKHTQTVYNYVKIIYESEPLLETEFIKSILINIQSACIHANIYNKNLEMSKNIIKFFDDLSKVLGIKESTTSYELIFKIKGDFWFKKGDFSAAINYYQKVINMMKSTDPKKPIVYFNLGCSFYLNKDKNNAIENLNQCINAFRVFDSEKKTFNVLIRQDVIIKKVNLAKYLLKNLGYINH